MEEGYALLVVQLPLSLPQRGPNVTTASRERACTPAEPKPRCVSSEVSPTIAQGLTPREAGLGWQPEAQLQQGMGCSAAKGCQTDRWIPNRSARCKHLGRQFCICLPCLRKAFPFVLKAHKRRGAMREVFQTLPPRCSLPSTAVKPLPSTPFPDNPKG